jgi:hypothetical protein
MQARTIGPDESSLYERDFVEWTRQTATLLRARRFDLLDVEHTAEEIEDIGKRDLTELNSRVRLLLVHLLKWQLQPRRRSRSWHATVVTQRQEIQDLLEQSPSLGRKLSEGLNRNYVRALHRASIETGLARDQFPPDCPYTVPQLLDDEFLPG